MFLFDYLDYNNSLTKKGVDFLGGAVDFLINPNNRYVREITGQNAFDTAFYGNNYPNPPAPILYAPQAAERALLNPTGDLTSLTGDAISESKGYQNQSIKDFFTGVANSLDTKNQADDENKKSFTDTILMIALIGLGAMAVTKL